MNVSQDKFGNVVVLGKNHRVFLSFWDSHSAQSPSSMEESILHERVQFANCAMFTNMCVSLLQGFHFGWVTFSLSRLNDGMFCSL